MVEENLEDKLIRCKDCKKKFIFTVKEQQFFGLRGWKDPIRCLECRKHKKLIRISLEEGVSISDKLKFSEICDDCGKRFYTTIRRKGQNIYCQDCWTKIKYGKPKRQGVDKSQEEAR